MDCEFVIVDANSVGARRAMRKYFAELDARFADGFPTADLEAALRAAPAAFNHPHGFFVVAGAAEEPVACGAVQHLDGERAEIKRMWVSPCHRGRGLATRLLAFLEDQIRQSGRKVAVLDTNAVLTEAVALYRQAGYRQIPRYNANPHADLWLAKDVP